MEFSKLALPSLKLEEKELEELLKIKDLILSSHKILIVGHSRPDGDCLGSSLALFWALKKLKKEVVPFCVDKPSYVYEFLPGIFEIQNKIDFDGFDLVIFVDCANERMSGIFKNGFPFSGNPKIVNIDHHPSNSFFGDFNLVSSNSAATCEIIFFLIGLLPVEMDKNIASCLLCGIYTDTGSFQNQNTSQRALEVASWLLRAGGKIKEITKYAFRTKKLSTLYLWGRAMSSLFKNEKYNLVITVITQEDIKETGSSEEDIEGIANFLNTLPEAKAVLVIYEKEGNLIKGSLRTRHPDYDVLPLAKALGGGGHKKAAGFSLRGSLKKINGRWQVI